MCDCHTMQVMFICIRVIAFIVFELMMFYESRREINLNLNCLIGTNFLIDSDSL